MKDIKTSYEQRKWEYVVAEHARMKQIIEKYSTLSELYNPLLTYAAKRKNELEEKNPLLTKPN